MSTDAAVRVRRIVEEYDGLGVHRTGTAVDDAGASWFIRELAHVGVRASTESFAFERLDVNAAHIDVAGQRLDGVPLFDGGSTGTAGIAGSLVHDTVGAAEGPTIGYVEIGATRNDDLAVMRAATEADALVVVPNPDAPADGLSLLNAPAFLRPFGPPVLQLSNEHLDLLRDSNGHECRITIDTQRASTSVSNVVGTVTGTQPDLSPAIVMTPRSSWWHSTGERGGGIAVFFEIARTIASAHHARTVHFVATTGHELGHLGLDHYLHVRGRLAANAHAWVHLGANFAAADPTQIVVQSSGAELDELLVGAMGRASVEPTIHVAGGTRPVGEAENIFDAGGRYVSMVGAQQLFHHERDRWPTNLDVDRAARLATSLAELTSALAS